MLTRLFAALMTVIVCFGASSAYTELPKKPSPQRMETTVIKTDTPAAQETSSAERVTAAETYLDASRAEEIALATLGLTRDMVRFDRTELDFERGKRVYEVELWADGTEYDLVIDAVTGEVLHQKQETERRPETDEYTPKPEVSAPQPEPPTAETYLDASRAEEIALETLGLTRDMVRFDRTELDAERGKRVYEVELWYDGTEYDFVIDSVTGEVLHQKQETERRPVTPEPEVSVPEQTPDPAEITQDQAIEIALTHAGLTEDQVTRLKIKKDRDDGVWIYEIEFRNGNTEYEYEIRVSDGTLLDYDKEYDD